MLEPEQLNDLLIGYASLMTPNKERTLPDLWDTLAGVREPAVMQIVGNNPIQTLLQEAVQKALRTQYRLVGSDEVVAPFKGPYTVAAIDLKGHLSGAVSSHSGAAYVHEGDLFPYAIRKAMLRCLIFSSGLESDRTYAEIKELLQGRPLFMGETETEAIASLRIDGLMLGASGCEPNDAYKSLLAGGMLREDSHDYAGGLFDHHFLQRVRAFITDPNSQEFEIQEHHDFALQRRMH